MNTVEKAGFYTERLVILLSEAQARELERLAELLGMTKTNFARDAIQSYLGMWRAEFKSKKVVDQTVDERVAGRDHPL